MKLDTWAFDFGVPRGPAIPALAKINDKPEHYYLLGMLTGANRPSDPLRWDMAEGVMFLTYTFSPLAHQPAPSVWRYELNRLVAGIDDGGRVADPKSYVSPKYTGTPVGGYRNAFGGWSVGEKLNNGKLILTAQGATVYYDFRAVDDKQLEMYLTVNGRPERWLYDGKDWVLKEKYDARIDGQFLVLPGGESVIAEHEGQWSVISDLHKATPRVVPIVGKAEGTPLMVIEDVDTGRAYFLQENRLYDGRGNVTKTMTAQPDSVATLRDAAAYVRELRSD